MVEAYMVYQIVAGSTKNLPDLETFLGILNNPPQIAKDLFNSHDDIYLTRAPGRLDVMGGIADYSGSLVLQLPLQEATLVALQLDTERYLRIISLGGRENQRWPDFEMSLADFERATGPLDYGIARGLFQLNPPTRWAAYIAGAFLVLMRERDVKFSQGARILIHSAVPEGKGVSSSAALEVAVMQAISAAYGLSLEPQELAVLCQKVENLVVGAPCGVMDQMTASLGEADKLLSLLCQPAEIQEFLPIPEQLAFWGIESGERHVVSGAEYNTVRAAAFMGYRMIADLAGLEVVSGRSGEPLSIADPFWAGYLANVTPVIFEERFASQIPETMSGAVFLDRYGGTSDSATMVDRKQNYPVRAATAHPIFEHERVKKFSELLGGAMGEIQMVRLGELMYQSHASYSACGLGSEGTDRLVEYVRSAKPQGLLYGARVTGGGHGGTVAVLGRHSAEEAVRAVAERYTQEMDYQPTVFLDSSLGSAMFGHLRLNKSGVT
jgi:L-arabinokinase